MLTVEFRDPVLFLTLNRPEVRNAFNDELIGALTAAFTKLPSGTRVVVLTGQGSAFCAGGDLEWMRKAAGYSTTENVADAIRLSHLFGTIQTCPAIVIARINGAAYGGGCGLVAAADLAVAADDAKFAFSEVKLGLIPATIAPFVLAKIGSGHARALFTTAEVFNADRAVAIGLVHEAVSAADLDVAVNSKIAAVLAAAPRATILARELVLEAVSGPEETARRLAAVRASDEGRQGVAAFLEKRKAAWVRPWP
ncbi:MAG: enoyl-CoA hydratase-related protein [Fimbriimonadaceae bacterium]